MLVTEAYQINRKKKVVWNLTLFEDTEDKEENYHEAYRKLQKKKEVRDPSSFKSDALLV